ncbi:copper transporter [Nocardiopsis rhodophaea]|uniref:Copper transporter n=1 Tax=Nocardiopsis rhodophaea TaxID=280238 RepID=A0ABN2SIY4_9ACTN
MIDFRYHLVSIVAIFLALTVGIVLGTTMLQDPLLNTLKAETSDLREQSDRLRTEKDVANRLNAGGGELISAYAEDMLDDLLTDVDVVILESPGADKSTRDELIARIEQAGGEVPGQVVFTDKYIDTGQATFVDELTEQLAEGMRLPKGGAYEKAGAELARAVLRHEQDDSTANNEDDTAGSEGASANDGGGDADTVDETGEEAVSEFDADAVLAGFSEAGLLTVQGNVVEQGDIAVVLAPAQPFPTESRSSPKEHDTPTANAAMLALARAADDAAHGAVLVGGPTSIEPGGLVAQARAQEARYSTVDTAGSTSGNVVAALAVAAAEANRSGAYGIGEGVDGFLPDPLPEPKENTKGNSEGSGKEHNRYEGTGKKKRDATASAYAS